MTGNSHYTVMGFMVTELHLKGYEKEIYAILYGFCQDGNAYTSGIDYLVEWTQAQKETVKKTLDTLEQKGLIQRKDVVMGNIRYQEYRLTERKAPRQITIKKNPENEPDYEGIVDYFNKTCVSLPRVTQINDRRKAAMRSAVENYGLDKVMESFRMTEESDFLTGRDGQWRGCAFDWIMIKGNMLKVLEGNYRNRKQSYPRHTADTSIEECSL